MLRRRAVCGCQRRAFFPSRPRDCGSLSLALAWSLLFGGVRSGDLAVGLVLAWLLLWWMAPVLGVRAYVRRLPRALALAGFVAQDLLFSGLRVAWDVVTPRSRRRPGVIEVPLDARSDLEITLLAHLVTLTPGTLALGVSADRRRLRVHAMFVDDPDALVASIKADLERRVLELVR